MGLVALLGMQQAQAKKPLHECDRLAKHPMDKGGLGLLLGCLKALLLKDGRRNEPINSIY